MSSLVLIGPRGAGKTVAGQGAAQRLGWDFLDTDDLVEARGRTVAEIFATEGEPAFRRLEREIIGDLRPARDTVVATGGGGILDAGNRGRLWELGPVVYLYAAPELLLERIAGSDRPALTAADPLTEMRQVLALRDGLYRDVAQTVLDTGSLDLAAVVGRLVALARTPGGGDRP